LGLYFSTFISANDSSYQVVNFPRKVYYQDIIPTKTVITETPRYEMTSWISEVGGVTSLLLGASVLTLYEVLEIAAVKLAHRISKKNKQIASQ
jgi:hypothetical protein